MGTQDLFYNLRAKSAKRSKDREKSPFSQEDKKQRKARRDALLGGRDRVPTRLEGGQDTIRKERAPILFSEECNGRRFGREARIGEQGRPRGKRLTTCNQRSGLEGGEEPIG